MTTYIVEAYLPAAPAAAFLSQVELRRVARALPGPGRVRHLRSIFVPQDETCFHLLEGPSADAVREVALAAIRFELSEDEAAA